MVKKVNQKLPQTKKIVVSKPKKKEVSKKLPKVKKTSAKTSKLTKEEKYWKEVDQLAQEKIYGLLTNSIPLPNLNLITEFWQYEDRQQKLSGLYLHKDVDYRTVLIEIEDQWYRRVEEEGEKLPSKEIMAEEVVLWYCRMVMKALIRDLSDYAVYQSYYFENLTSDEY